MKSVCASFRIYGLQNRVAHGLILFRIELLVRVQAEVRLGNPPRLADRRNHLEPAGSKNALHRLGFLAQTDAERQAEALVCSSGRQIP